MCDVCQGKYGEFSALKSELGSAANQAMECKYSANRVKSTLSSVVICGVGIDREDTTNIIKCLDVVNACLVSLISQCSQEMSRIESSCPGPDHYKPKNKRLNSENC